MPIIWPLREKLSPPVFSQQRPRWTGWRPVPNPPRLPWSRTSPSTQPRVVHQLLPYPPTYFRITGITKDSTGAVLGNCIVDWFNTANDALLGTTTSDVNGAFEFRTAGQPPNAYYLVAYKAGAPDVTGATVNTLTGV